MDEVKIFAQILRKADKEMYKFLHAKLLEAGKRVATAAKSEAAWSSRIPDAIRTRSTIGSISVYVDQTIAPEARPLEHGGLTGTFRHPVFGNTNNWVDQAAQPFLTPALLKKRSEVLDLINLAMEETNAMIARGK